MLRTIRRWFSTEETKQLGDDLDKLIDRHSDLGHKIEGMQLRIERHVNKLQMRDARAQRGGNGAGLSDEEQEIVNRLRSGDLESPLGGRDPFLG